MAKKHEVEIRVHDFDPFDDLLTELAKPGRSHIRLVKVDDEGLVEPARQGTALVMQPRVRIVATALDHTTGEILRYQKKWDVGSGKVTINVFRGRGSYSDPTGAKTRDQIIAALEARGFSVSQGEWTLESAKDALAGLAAS
jgi:hypothetical protein